MCGSMRRTRFYLTEKNANTRENFFSAPRTIRKVPFVSIRPCLVNSASSP